MLSDSEKRTLYDETGIVDDGAEGGVGGGAEGEAHWTDYWRHMFPEVTEERIEEFAKTYRGSEGTAVV